MKALTNSLLLSLGTAIGTQLSLRVINARQPRPMPHQHAAALDHPWRLRYRNPQETLGLFGFQAGMTVLDLGCGTGTFTVDMARMVGDSGAVHAVDLQQPLLEQARQRIDAAGVSPRVRFHHAGAYQLPLADGSIDLAVLIATLSEIPDKRRALAELRRVLKPRGRLAVSEELPDPAYLPAAQACRSLEDAGFEYGGKSGGLFCYSLLYFNPVDPNR